MARIPLTSGFTLIPEGNYVFRIYSVKYEEKFGKMEIGLVNAQGLTQTEKFTLMSGKNTVNEKAMNAFSYFAKTALNDYAREDIDPMELIDCYIRADVVHTKLPSTKEEGKFVTFANLGEKAPADGFDTTPVPKALTLGKENAQPVRKPAPQPTQQAAPKPATGFDLKALLG